MKTKHTKGEWIINTEYSKSTVIQKETGFPIAETSYSAYKEFKRNSEEIKANAKLIASAPELLDALQSLLAFAMCNVPIDNYDLRAEYYDEKEKALKAIEKATE